MNKKKKKYLVTILLVTILIGINFSKNAYALWENEDYNWKYIGEQGYEMGWQQIDGVWYYFNLETGIMEIGWFYDNQYKKWYYFNPNGSIDITKTTQSYPLELQNIGDRIRQHVSEEIDYKWTRNIDGNIFACFTSKNNIAPQQYYYQPSTGNIYGVKNGVFTDLVTHDQFNIFTENKAVELVRKYLSKNNKYIPKIIEVEADEGDSYLVHCYDDMGDYTVANDWYYVNKDTREVRSML